jgi:hypothetical protein
MTTMKLIDYVPLIGKSFGRPIGGTHTHGDAFYSWFDAYYGLQTKERISNKKNRIWKEE